MKTTIEQKEFAIYVLNACLKLASEDCDHCRLLPYGAGNCACQTSGGDLIDEVSRTLQDLRIEVAAEKK